jgi:hypothetical protein
LNLEKYSLFTNNENNDLSMKFNDLMRKITNKKRIVEMIKHKGNLSASRLGRLICPIFKSLPEESIDLFIAILKMLFHTRKKLL